jgi:hypothetical protein
MDTRSLCPEEPHEPDERPDDRIRLATPRGIDATRLVHHRGLQVGASNMDRQRADRSGRRAAIRAHDHAIPTACWTKVY